MKQIKYLAFEFHLEWASSIGRYISSIVLLEGPMRVSLYYSIRRCFRLLITNRMINNWYSRSFYSFLALYTWNIVYSVVDYIERKLQNYMQLARKMFPEYSRRCQIGLLYIAGTFSGTRTDSLQNEDIYQYIYQRVAQIFTDFIQHSEL